MIPLREVYGCIIAGESDLAFWPKSRLRKPRFLLSFGGDGSVLRKDFELLTGLCSVENKYVVVPEAFLDKAKAELPETGDNFVTEPLTRGSLNSLSLAVSWITAKASGGMVIAIPSDLLVGDKEAFSRSLQDALLLAESQECFVTVGSKPTYPDPSLFYLKLGGRRDSDALDAYTAVGLIPQPNRTAALKMMESGDYMWCSGVLVFRASLWWKYLKRKQPDLLSPFRNIKMAVDTGFYKRVIATEFARLKALNLWESLFADLAAPRSRALAVVETEAPWQTLTGWRTVSRAVDRDQNGNVASGPVLAVDSNECILESDKDLVVTVGLQDIVVISTDDVVLVCNKNKQEEVKAVLDLLRANGMQRYL